MTDKQKRCQDCACLIKKGSKWLCDECFGQPIEEVDDCPEGMTLEEVEELNEKAEKVKINHGATAKEQKKDKKPRTVKISDEKIELFQTILQNLDRCDGVTRDNIQILKENKLISVQIGEKTFKIDIIETRKKKA